MGAARGLGRLATVLVVVLAVSPEVGAKPRVICCGDTELRVAAPDLQANGIEVTQGVQSLGSDPDTLPAVPPAATTLPARGADGKASYSGVRLVAHGDTVARFFATSGSASSVRSVGAQLYGTRGGRALPGSPLTALEGFKTLAPGGAGVTIAERSNSGAGFTFDLPDDWTSGTITLTGVLTPLGRIDAGKRGLTCEFANARCASSDTFTLENIKFVDDGYVRVRAVPLVVSGQQFDDFMAPEDLLARARAWGPVASDGLIIDPSYAAPIDITDVVNAQSDADLEDDCALLDPPACDNETDLTQKKLVIVAQRLLDAAGDCATVKRGVDARCPDEILGVDRGHFGGGHDYGHLTGGQFPVQVVIEDPGLVAHEMFHSWSRAHTEGCGAANPEPWPDDHAGYIQAVGLDLTSGSGTAFGGVYHAIAGPMPTPVPQPQPAPVPGVAGQWYDVMSSCRNHANDDVWISAYGWDQQFDEVLAYNQKYGRAAATASAARPPATPGLDVRAAAIGDRPPRIQRVRPGLGVAVDPPQASPYHAVVLARNGAVLADAPLAALDSHADGLPGAMLELEGHVPLAGAAAGVPPSVASVAIVKDGATVARRARSAHAPTVTLTAPAAGAHVGKGEALAVRWSAADADSTRLAATVDFSADGGHRFRTVYSGRDAGAATIGAADLERATDARVRVRISDGFDETAALSGQLAIAGRDPQVQILRPAQRARVRADGMLSLVGRARDDRFATLRGPSLQWFVGARRVGTGTRLSIAPRRPGKLALRLVAHDALGRTAEARRNVTIVPAEPQLLTLRAPRHLPKSARRLRLRLAANVACKLAIGGDGRGRAKLSRHARAVRVAVRPGTADLRIVLALTSGRLETRIAVVVPR